jgi:hypothetical protein
MNVILEGIVGSTAYGLAHEGSDVDRLGVFQAPTRDLLGIERPNETRVTRDPDTTYHELGKFVKLALACNPSILELLFLESYTRMTVAGWSLVLLRDSFLSRRVFDAYGGYAYQQAKRLEARGDSFGSDTKNRTAKHARHCLRLLQQGRQLLETGSMRVRIDNPEELLAFGQLPVPEIVARFEEEYAAFRAIATILPDQPDKERINDLLVNIRLADVEQGR